MRSSSPQSPRGQAAGRLCPAPGKAPAGSARAGLRVPWVGRGCLEPLHAFVQVSNSSCSSCPSRLVPAHHIPRCSRALGAGVDGYETAAGCTRSSAQRFSGSWRNVSIQNSLTWSKLGETEPAAPGTAAIPCLEQLPPCQPRLPARCSWGLFPTGRGISPRQGGDGSLVPVGCLVSQWGQRGGSSRQSPRASLALGGGCQAQIPQDRPPVGNPGWQWDVSPSGRGQGWWQPVPPRASLLQAGVEGRMGLSPPPLPDLVTSLQLCSESRKTPPCHAGNGTTVSAQPLPTPPGQFLGLEPCRGCRRIPPSLLSADSPPPAWKIPLN